MISAYLIAALLVIVPLTAGWLVGRAVGRISAAPVRFAASTACLVLPLQAAWLAAEAMPHWSTWDLLASAALLGAGVIAAGIAPKGFGKRDLALFGVAWIVTFAGLELGVRLLLPDPPDYPTAAAARLVFEERRVSDAGPASTLETGRPWRCEALFPARYPDYFRARVPDKADRRVLHVGDSMVEGVGIAKTFVHLLSDGQGATAHINAGVSSTGPDYHSRVIDAWVSVADVSHVVQYIYLGNDFQEIGQGYFCCSGGPILDLTGEAPVPLCEAPDYGMSFTQLLANSPAPYPIRVGCEVSFAARHISRVFDYVGASVGTRYGLKLSRAAFRETLDELGMLLRTSHGRLQSAGIGYTIVVLPSLRGMTGSADDLKQSLAMTRAVRSITAELGIRTLDPRRLLTDALRDEGIAGLYIVGTAHVINDHFNARGHQLFADWLAKEL